VGNGGAAMVYLSYSQIVVWLGVRIRHGMTGKCWLHYRRRPRQGLAHEKETAHPSFGLGRDSQGILSGG
jgi:hypothetical protein